MRTRREAMRHGGMALAGGLLAGCGSRSARAQPAESVRPEDFGARGDGRTDDTDAFARMSAAIRAAGGGTVVLARKTYLVGRQQRPIGPSDFSFEPADIINIYGCVRPVQIMGEGATLRAADAMRFGTFDPATGRATHHSLPFYRRGELATPYRAMIALRRNTGGIHIEGLTLVGPVGRLEIGGPFGDTGHQIEGTGLWLVDNAGDEVLADLTLDRHPLDGLIIDGPDSAGDGRRTIDRVRSSDNGRQGVSVIGGHGYRFAGCHFARSGRGGLSSAPGAGVDLEAEGEKRVRAITFDDCDFPENAGPGLLAESGDVADVRVTRSRFEASNGWAAWPNKPGMSFTDCRFIGAIANAWGDADPARAARFTDCEFCDTTQPGGRGRVARGPGPIADLSDKRNVRFERTRFLLDGPALLPWSTYAIYADCEMRQRAAAPSYPRGQYLGDSRITGNADLTGSRITGRVTLNGRVLRG